MDYEIYRTFMVLCETKNFTAASKRLHVVQSTVSNRIKEMENYYQKMLFTRENKSVSLTPAGSQLYPYIKRLLDLEVEAKEQMALMSDTTQYQIGSFQLAYQCYLKDNIMNQHLDHQYNIRIEHSWTLYEYLDDHLIDIAYTSYLDRRDKYSLLLEFSEPIVHVRAPIYSGDAVVYAPFSEAFIDWYNHNYPSMKKVVSIDQSVETIDYILNGVGSGFLPESIAINYIKKGQLVVVESDIEAFIHKTFVMCRSKDKEKIKTSLPSFM